MFVMPLSFSFFLSLLFSPLQFLLPPFLLLLSTRVAFLRATCGDPTLPPAPCPPRVDALSPLPWRFDPLRASLARSRSISENTCMPGPSWTKESLRTLLAPESANHGRSSMEWRPSTCLVSEVTELRMERLPKHYQTEPKFQLCSNLSSYYT